MTGVGIVRRRIAEVTGSVITRFFIEKRHHDVFAFIKIDVDFPLAQIDRRSVIRITGDGNVLQCPSRHRIFSEFIHITGICDRELIVERISEENP